MSRVLRVSLLLLVLAVYAVVLFLIDAPSWVWMGIGLWHGLSYASLGPHNNEVSDAGHEGRTQN